MPVSKKPFSILSSIGTLAVVGGIAALGVQLYRRPWETTSNFIRAGLLLVGAREATCDVNGIPMHYYVAGNSGTPIVLIHGLGGSGEGWAPLILRLRRGDGLSSPVRVYVPDLPGFGKTPLAPEGVNVGIHALYVTCFLDALGIEQAILVGNSLGGWIATRVALDHPERVQHLYLLNSAGLRREGGHSPYAPTREAALSSIKHMWNISLPVPGFVLDAMIRNSQRPAYKGFVEKYDSREELDDVLGQIRVPTTILWGTEDRLLPLVCAHDFHAGIPNSELILLPGAGHTPQVKAAAEIARIILSRVEKKQKVS
jgi:pimeloyl-ACP methyl ester carboxylesterase